MDDTRDFSDRRFDVPMDIDDIPEFHAGRLLMLLRLCGDGSTGLIRGRTKLAKLDFFVRYPSFLESGLRRLREKAADTPEYIAGTEGVEANMIRYKYGPWDHRYYNLLALLYARGLMKVGAGSVESYSLTLSGRKVADALIADPAFNSVVDRCRVVRATLAHLSGTELKRFVYETFTDEIASLPRGAIIRPGGGAETEA